MTRFRKPCGWGDHEPSDTRPPLTPWLSGEIVTHSQKYWYKLHWATPPWMDDKLWAEMKAIYESAKPFLHHVDHIVPLKGKCVCGLHVPWNLEVICKKQNMIKSNHTLPDIDDMFPETEPHQLTLIA